MIAMPGAPGPIAPPAANFVPSPPPAPTGSSAASVDLRPAAPAPAATANRAAPAAARDQAAPAPQSAPASAGAVSRPQPAEPQRAKQEAEATDAVAAKELKKSATVPNVPMHSISGYTLMANAELERIAKLREAGKQDEADRALDEFKKNYPDFHIPELMWERVRRR
jgi:hypothetical protein